MREMQTRENGPRDSWILGAVGIDIVSELWQNPAKVHGLFAKTGAFPGNDLAIAVKTKMAPARLPANEGLTRGIGGARG